jgi:hypothetical protein
MSKNLKEVKTLINIIVTEKEEKKLCKKISDEKIIRIKGKDTYTLLCAREIVWWIGI